MNKKLEEVRWGIIGCGDVTEVKSGPALSLVPHSRLVAVMRRNAEKARDYARRHQVPKWYADAAKLINDPEVNAIYIATPPSSHEEYALHVLEAGKPVYLEKPMSLNADSARRIASAAEHSGLPLTVAHYRRQQPYFLKIKSLLQEGIIGQPRLAELWCLQPHLSQQVVWTEDNWRLNPTVSGGGLFHDLAPHQLDLMIYFFGKAQKLAGLSFNSGGYYEADDTTSGEIIFDKQVLFRGVWCFSMNEKKEECIITGSEGSMSFSIFGEQKIRICKNGKEEQVPFTAPKHVQQPMIEKVVQYFRGESENPCSAEEGVQVMELMDGISCSRLARQR